jgi:EAL domain-containing protein (putative c-di-GMP-specific phosphodiesterase class I)
VLPPADATRFRGGDVQRVLELARKHLGMDLAYLAEFTDGKQVYRGLAGDAASFGSELGDGPALGDTYCRLMTQDLIANAIPDTAVHPVLRELGVTQRAGIGSYVGVPIRLADGSLYGSLCTLSHSPQPVDHKDARFLLMLAELVAADVQADHDRSVERARLLELISSERLATALQPIVDIGTGRVCGVEALSRFPPEYGRPDQVFAAASTVGVGTQLERLAAAGAYALLPMLPPEVYMGINLTPTAAIDLVTAADSYVGQGVSLERLVLEITEHAAVESYELLRDCLASVRGRGLRLAIDDAGAGYASLHHIVELRPDIIKVDRSLIDGMSADAGRHSVVKAFVSLASDLGATVVAEGVEQRADLDAAGDMGVDAAQGYLLARPSTDRDDIPRWLDDDFGVGGPTAA